MNPRDKSLVMDIRWESATSLEGRFSLPEFYVFNAMPTLTIKANVIMGVTIWTVLALNYWPPVAKQVHQ